LRLPIPACNQNTGRLRFVTTARAYSWAIWHSPSERRPRIASRNSAHTLAEIGQRVSSPLERLFAAGNVALMHGQARVADQLLDDRMISQKQPTNGVSMQLNPYLLFDGECEAAVVAGTRLKADLESRW
jgi:hypothetical protein